MLPELSHPHAQTAEECLTTLGTLASGLTTDNARQRLAKYGPNHLPEEPRRPALVRFLLHFHNVLMYVLLGAAAMTAALGHMIDTWVILAVVLVNAIMGFIQEGRAENAMAAIRQMLAPHASVLRDGKRISIDAVNLVPGDIVLLEPGDRVAADLRLMHINGLHVQEAILTGESVPVEKASKPAAADAALGDRASIAFSGTLVASGTGRGVVVATGAGTRDWADQRNAWPCPRAANSACHTDGQVCTLVDGSHSADLWYSVGLRLLRATFRF